MKKIINTVALWLMVIVLVFVFCLIAYTRFTNIDATETRLFLIYWKEYIISVICVIALYFIVDKTSEG